MHKNFYNHDDFDEYVKEQDKWICDDSWSLPEHNKFGYMLEKSAKYNAGKLVEYIVMLRSENITNHISVFHKKSKQNRDIWSGFVDSPDEYQVMMDVVKKFIEEYKNNSGAT